MSRLLKRGAVVLEPVHNDGGEPKEAGETGEITDASQPAANSANTVNNTVNYEELFKDLAYRVLEEHSSQTLEKTAGLFGDEKIAQAQRTAELIVNHTLETTKFEMTNVIAQGYADGFAEGKQEALSVIEPAMAKIAVFFESVARAQDLMLENFKDGIFSIISEISSKIMHREINKDDEYLTELFRDAVKSIKVEEFVTLTVSESQIDFAVRNADIFKAAVSNIQDFKITAEKDAPRGTMIVETAKTIADASYYVQEEKIDEILQQMRNTLVIPQSAEEIEEIEKIRSMRDENLQYINNNFINYDNNSENIENIENLEKIDNENSENESDINNAGI
jgi:flagellar biosynthesis/type III secretory pathway protein FliH